MVDFLTVSYDKDMKKGVVDIYPAFRIDKRTDLMTRGSDFYAVWDEAQGLWSTDELDVIRMVDTELDKFAQEHNQEFAGFKVKIRYMWSARTGSIDVFHKYVKQQLRDRYHTLDEKLIFSNQTTKKTDFASKTLDYPLEEGSIEAYETLMNTLYSPEERNKIEWAIGSIVAGDSGKLQKFLVLYGAAGTGKSTVLNIIQQLFDGYYSVFDAKALGSANNSFALEPFKDNPLVAIQHDGDLSHIEDNTRLNSLVSHELMTVNEKFKSTYSNRFKCFLFLGTNKPVRITDAKSGLIRRLIDVSPTGNKVSLREYRQLMNQIGFELGPIAYHCKQVYLEDPLKYDEYVPTSMLAASNDFYNYIGDYFMKYKDLEDGISRADAYKDYNDFCKAANVAYPYSLRQFGEELKNYFAEFKERYTLKDGTRVRSYYSGFLTDKFLEYGEIEGESKKKSKKGTWLQFKKQKSLLDEMFKDCQAQYANSEGQPSFKWDNVTTTLKDIRTSELHYVRGFPENHIVIDFDIPDENGNKCYDKNYEEASQWPRTYAELSKSGAGIHLHYIYRGDPSKLSRVFDDHIEIKVFSGKSSLRRKLTKCNDIPVAFISSNLPLKGEKNVVDQNDFLNEKGLRTFIMRALNKEHHGHTRPEIDFIYSQLEKQYASGREYDVSDLKPDVLAFAAGSTNQANYCFNLVSKMHFKSEPKTDIPEHNNKVEISNKDKNGEPLILFYDVEVFPNLLLINYKAPGEDQPVIRMINPQPDEVRDLFQFRLIGFNCRRYDNHILWARANGYSLTDIYNVSQRIVGNDRSVFFGQAYNLSYTDIYDFSSKKQSLKKWEIEMTGIERDQIRQAKEMLSSGVAKEDIAKKFDWTISALEKRLSPSYTSSFSHVELGLPWDEPVPEEQWEQVAEYCDNDVISTEALFYHLKGDWRARQILADIAGATPNTPTNQLTQRIVFGWDKEPWKQFNYRKLGDISKIDETKHLPWLDEFTQFDENGLPIFPGYEFVNGKSTYRGEEVGEGGWVFSKPGMYGRTVSFDVASMHPSTIKHNNLFGPYTKNFNDILDTRIAIKHGDYDKAKGKFGGKLDKYLNDKDIAKDLSQALKIAINAVYGQTMMPDKYGNPFRDPRNIDNFVAKCGALFMVNLKNMVEDNGFNVIHIKTDSIKVENPNEEIAKKIEEYGQLYGYTFEVEDIFEKICLMNDAVYIAKLAKDSPDHPGEWYGKGAQVKEESSPYVFKKLFSKQPIEFEDMCETMSVDTALYLDFNEGLPEGEHNYRFIGKVGRFTPMQKGWGAGVLLRQGKDKEGNVKYDSASGAKGYLWMESEVVQSLHLEEHIDRSYYNKQVDDLIEDISKFGDFEAFASDDDPADRKADIQKAEAELLDSLEEPSPF